MKAHSFDITEADFDLVRRFDATPYLQADDNVVDSSFLGKGSAMYQVTCSCFMRRNLAPRAPRAPVHGGKGLTAPHRWASVI